jgi:hypothetical protein
VQEALMCRKLFYRGGKETHQKFLKWNFQNEATPKLFCPPTTPSCIKQCSPFFFCIKILVNPFLENLVFDQFFR